MPPTKRKQAAEEAKVDVSSMTVAQLKKELESRNLDTSGLKAVLAKRLQSAIDDGDDASAAPAKKAKDAPAKEDSEEEESDKEEEPEASSASSSSTRSSKRVQGLQQEAAKVKAAEDKLAADYGKWTELGTVYVLDGPGVKPSAQIAAFDMDDTWIETKSGNTFAKTRNDWQWLFPTIPAMLKELHEKNFKIVIFTNQSGIHADQPSKYNGTKAGQIKGKILDLAQELGFPIQAFIAAGDDNFRKPQTAMWELLASKYNGGIKPDLKKSYYVGDAAGRVAGWKVGRKKDFACTDRKFANNVGIPFHTPEEFFLGEEVCAKFEWGGIDVAAFVTSTTDATGDEKGKGPAKPQKGADDMTSGGIASLTVPHQEMVICVGFPASGKSTLSRKYMVPKGYVHVNMDTLKTKPKCLKTAQEGVNAGKSVVIDNTNPSKEARGVYIKMAKAAGIPVRCFRLETDEELAKHMNMYRERITGGTHKHVPRIAYASYKSKFQEPDIKEGFKEIKRITFVPVFETEKERQEFEKKA